MALEVGISLMDDPARRGFELVERKGIGHPDTICDALAERLSAALCRFYLDRFGFILHHNVDKVLLRGGASNPRFGGGEVVEPIEIFFAGRAVASFGGVEVPVEDLARQVARDFFRETFHTLDFERHVRVHCLVRKGSCDLVELFMRQRHGGVWLANDTSIGVGFAPLSTTERIVLEVDHALTAPGLRAEHPAFGEDLKILAVRRGSMTEMTVALAFCDRYLSGVDSYLAEKTALAAMVDRVAGRDMHTRVNAADLPETGSVYLTVTGTSAEAGDDGEVGRGNRVNGLITPGRPMTMEAAAGKNPVSHVGKLYNVVARDIAEAVVGEVPGVSAAECYLASCIGRPVAEPQLVEVRLASDAGAADRLRPAVAKIVARQLAGLDIVWRSFVAGAVVF